MSEGHHRSRDILDDWTVRRIAGPDVPDLLQSRLASGLSAVVPGVVHLDLVREGLLRHPDEGDGESEQAWVGESDWTWTRPLHVRDLPEGCGEDDVLEVVFDSIDTVGTIRIGERSRGEVENQFHPHRFRVRREDVSAGSRIEVALRSPMRELRRRVERYGDRPVNADGEWGVYSYLRKAACSFGWDWGPKCPSLGLPGKVRIEAWRDARIDAIRPLIVACDERTAIVEVAVELCLDAETAGDGRLMIEVLITAPDGRAFASEVEVESSEDRSEAGVRLEIPDPDRWWPRGLGRQPLHRIQVRLLRGDDELGADQRRIGLRSTTLDTEPDSEGTPFRILVNGETLFCQGANWIPDGLFPGTAPDDRTRERIEQAADAGFNMLRVWGGGVYESNAFYERCDELGMMVWQDFMFACATYPEEDPYPELVETEARHQVSRLSSHASIVLWCGGNENVLAWRNWGWREKMDPDQSWGRRYFTELLPAVCRELDPSRPCLPDSPWSGTVEHDPNDPDHGDRHTWDFKVEDFREHVPRFVSEFGHQAPPGRVSIESAIGSEALASESVSAMEAFASRQRGWGGDAEQYDRWLDDWFTPATDLDGRLWRMQLLQARATGMAFEWARFNRPRCAGALIWQLNDAWTGHSWSLIDVRGRPKPSWWSAREACRPRSCAFLVGESGIEVGFVNDTRDRWVATATVRRLAMSGDQLAEASFDIDLKTNAVSRMPLASELMVPSEPGSEFLVVEVDAIRGHWFYGKDAWLSMPAPSWDLQVEPTGEATRVRLRSETLIRDLHLDVARISAEARASANVLTMLPGEERIIDIEGIEFDAVADLVSRLRRPGVITTANDCAARETPRHPMP